MIARMQIRQTAWEAVLSTWNACASYSTTGPCSLPQDVQAVMKNSAREIDATNPAGFVLINANASKAALDGFYNYFAPADTQGYWKWNFNGKVDFATEYTGQHNDILATQPAGATFQSPKWVNVWAGQGDQDYVQRFARSVDRSFDGSFS